MHAVPDLSRETTLIGPGVKILTFDGGGFRGLASLYLLRAVMRRILPDVKDALTIRPCEYFEYALHFQLFFPFAQLRRVFLA